MDNQITYQIVRKVHFAALLFAFGYATVRLMRMPTGSIYFKTGTRCCNIV